MAQVYGNVKNGIQLKYTDANDSSVTRTVNGVNVADTIVNTDDTVEQGGYTIEAVSDFGEAVKTLVGASTIVTSLIQTRVIA